MKTIIVKKPTTNPTMRRICAFCGNPIPLNKREDAKYCSLMCQKAAKNARVGWNPNFKEFLHEKRIMDGIKNWDLYT